MLVEIGMLWLFLTKISIGTRKMGDWEENKERLQHEFP